jgi:magnesium and cobalt transporter
LFARDLLGIDLSEKAGRAGLLRMAYFVPETLAVADLLLNFRRRKKTVALTVDEYGGVTGLVTMEDIVECIFGDINSRSEVIRQQQVKFEALGGGRFRVEGSMTLNQFNELVGTAFDDDEVETIGGVLLNEFGELPVEGARIVVGEHAFTVMSLAQNRIDGVTVEPAIAAAPALADPAADEVDA